MRRGKKALRKRPDELGLATSSNDIMERLQTKRVVTRSEIQRLSEELQAMTTQDPEPEQECRLEEIAEELEVLARELTEQNELIEPHVTNANLEEEYRGVQESQGLVTRMRTRIRRLERGTSSASGNNVHETNARATGQPEHRAGQLRLPKLELQRFNGNKLDWLPFWEQFNQAIHENDALSSVEKFLYLRTALTGKAAASISGIQATEQNYTYVVKLLKERFGKQDVLIQEHLTQLLNLPHVKTLSDVVTLRRLDDHIHKNIAGLKTLGVKSDSYGAMLCAALFRVLPADWAVEFHKLNARGEQNVVPDDSTLDAILRSLRTELESREKVYDGSAQAQPQTPREHGGKNRPSDRNVGKGSAASLTIGSKPSNERCALCSSSSHDTSQCNAKIPLEEKKKKLRTEGRCYRCAKRGHIARECRNRSLRCSKCSRRHITPLCDPRAPFPDGETATEVHSTASLSSSSKDTVLLQTAQVWVDGPYRKRLARCLLDGGSQRSFVTEHISRELKLEVIGEEEVTIYPFGGAANVTKKKRRLVRVWLRSQHSRKEHCVEALEIEDICTDRLVLPDSLIKTAGLAELELADVTLPPACKPTQAIEILVGADYYWKIVSGDVRKLEGSLSAVKTDFGWTLHGPIPQMASVVSCTTVAVLRTGVLEQMSNLSNELRAFWELESLGISANECAQGGEEEKVRKDFISSLDLVNGRYEVNLPWKTLDRHMESNEAIARQRLDKLMRRLGSNNERLSEYDTAIRSYLREGFAEKVPEAEIDTSDRVYYMPHRDVLRPNSSTTKTRIVFDASAKARGCQSLNDALETGPHLNPELLKTVINFRCHAIALTADIEKAFLQIVVKQEDRDALRFLWYAQPPTEDSKGAETEVWRMTRVPFGSTSSPFMLAATVKHHLANVSEDLSETAMVLNECLYVDDLIAGADTVERATSLYEEAQQILSSAGMKLRKWNSNSDSLQQRFEEDGLGNPSSESATSSSAVTRVLGLEWDRNRDELKYSMETTLELLTINRNTKRFVLQTSARIFDPLGLISPVTISAKMLFQELWTLGLDWDTQLPQDVSMRWNKWIEALPHLKDISIPRRYACGKEAPELHIFTDASPQAYGAVAYLRSENGNQTTVTLIMAKTRVAPLKTLSLPRLELMGVLLGARMCAYLKGAMDLSLSAVTLWTDSTIALHWVKGPAVQWKPFVANRVKEVQEKTEPSDWRHCPGIDNPADLLTRGVSPDSLKSCDKWWNGPTWLSKSPTGWPSAPVGNQSLVTEEEKRSSAAMVSHTRTNTTKPFVAIERFGELNRLLRVTAWAQRFVNNCRRNADRAEGPLSAEEIQEARLLLVRQVQKETFGEAFDQSRRFIGSGELHSLNLFLDDKGVVRLKGRLQHSNLCYETAHPIVLPASHHFVELLIRSTHQRLLHAGCLEILTHLRETFWIIRARQAVKKVLGRCVTCRKMNSRRATEPVAPLPGDRVLEATPFAVTGLDFAGPILTKDEGKTHKSYVLLLTCSVTRAVHLEVVKDMSTASFLQAFRRFVARRGLCHTIYSDNAKTFHRASGELQKIWKTMRTEETLDYMSHEGIKWKFIVERAAWWGGFWERMVRSVKTPLKKVLGCSYVTFEELSTISTEIEAVINSRPLTHVATDSKEPEPLTPAHFLVGRRIISLPSQGGEPTASSADELSRRWKYRERLSTSLWRRWRKEYLCTLRSFHHTTPAASSNIQINDLVIIQDDFHPRQTWKTGRIIEVFPGRDGHIRSCVVRLPGGATVRRPVQLLYRLEGNKE